MGKTGNVKDLCAGMTICRVCLVCVEALQYCFPQDFNGVLLKSVT